MPSASFVPNLAPLPFLTQLQQKVAHIRQFPLKATSHSTICDIPMRPLREDQKHRHGFTL